MRRKEDKEKDNNFCNFGIDFSLSTKYGGHEAAKCETDTNDKCRTEHNANAA